MMPNIQSLVRTDVDGETNVKSHVTLGGFHALGATVGAINGGILTAYLSWRWDFRVEILTLIAILRLRGVIPKDAHKEKRPSLEWISVILQAVGLILILGGILLADTHGFLIASQPLMLGPVSLPHFGLAPAVLLVSLTILFLFLIGAWQRHRERLGQTSLINFELLTTLNLLTF